MKNKDTRFFPQVLIVYGPTGVGKTDFVLNLASRIPAEVINMDMGQFYTPFSVGTAKPNWRFLPVKHHLFDILNEPVSCTVTDYRELCLLLIKEIVARGNLPIIVGGSGFYLKSLFFPPVAQSGAAIDHDDFSTVSTEVLWEQLYLYDQKRAESIDKNDRYRIHRALAIWYGSGKKPSDSIPYFEKSVAAHIVFLGRDRDELYDRINQRVDAMFADGWIEETVSLKNTPWELFITEKKLIGYADILSYLNSDSNDMTTMVAAIKQKTRHYAKRQYTFWRMLAKAFSHEQKQGQPLVTMESLNLTFMDLDLYIKRLVSQLTV